MTTSVLMASSDQNTNLTLSEDDYHQDVQTTTTRHEHHQTPRGPRHGSNNARRKSSRGGNESKKKQPQRGMGVEKLERLRLGDRWKKMTEFNSNNININPSSHAVIPTSFGHDPTSLNTVPMHLTKLGVYPLMNMNQPAMLVQRVGGNFYGVGVGNGNEKSKELSSTPNLIKSYSDHCSVCHQKKRNIRRENLVLKGAKDLNGKMHSLTNSDFVGLNVGNSPNNSKGTNQDFGKKATFCAGTYSIGTMDQGVEVVAVHRKASSPGGGSGKLFMEYEFFPSGNGGGRSNSHESDHNELMRMMMMEKVGGTESSSSVAAAVMDGDVAVDGTNSIDLSLRLSC